MNNQDTLAQQARDRIYHRKLMISRDAWLEIRNIAARYIGDLSIEGVRKLEEEMRKMFVVVE